MLSREWHPDKVAHRRQRQRMKRKQQREPPPPPPPMDENIQHVPPPPPPPPPYPSNNDNEDNNDKDEGEEYARQKLQQITNAYEILNNDHTRIIYHKYGIIESSNNAIIQLLSTGQILVGRPEHQISSTTSTSEGEEEKLARLLELMGYPSNLYWQSSYQDDNIHQESSSSSSKQRHQNHHSTSTKQIHLQQQRISYLTSTITERLRPLVEGTISQDLFVSEIYRECNALKKIGLGAHILRCIGRAYRIEGYRVLRTMSTSHHHGKRRRRRRRHHSPRHTSQQQQYEDVADLVIDTVRNMKHYASAAFAGGKLVLLEQRIKKLEEEYARGKQQVKKKKKEQQQWQYEKQQQMDGDEKKNVKMIQQTSQDDSYQMDNETYSRFASNIGALPGDDIDIDTNNDATYSDDDDEDDFLFQQHFSHHEDEDNHDNINDELEDELNHIQHKKTYTALLTVHQMEALWKITKIELSHTIRKACRCILMEPSFTTYSTDEEGEDGGGWSHHQHHENHPQSYDNNGGKWHYDDIGDLSSSQAPPPPPPSSGHDEYNHQNNMHSTNHQQPRSHRKYDGWVSTMGKGIPLEVGRLRAAAALILIGDIMVQTSKEV